MNPTDIESVKSNDIDTHNNSTDKPYSVEVFDTESNEMVTFVYRNEKTCKDKPKEMNLRGMNWRDKEMIIRILDQKQKDEEDQRQKDKEYRGQKDEKYRRQKDEEYWRRNRYIFIKGRTQ